MTSIPGWARSRKNSVCIIVYCFQGVIQLSVHVLINTRQELTFMPWYSVIMKSVLAASLSATSCLMSGTSLTRGSTT